MNRSFTFNRSYKKNKASGFRKLIKTSKGRKIVKMRRRKGRKII